MSPSAPDYSIVIPAYNEEELLPATLSSVRRAMAEVPGLRGEIVVTDNDSTDLTAEVARDGGARVVFEEQRQIARSRNTGGHHAHGRYLIFLDADTQITPRLLDQTLAALESGEVCAGGTMVRLDRSQRRLEKLALGLWCFLSRWCRWACGAYVFCLREAFEETGGFDERFYASEEIHFSRALKRWGRKRRLRFLILDEPVATSARKLDWYGPGELWSIALRLLLKPSSARSPEACKLWYERPLEKRSEQ